MHAGPDESKAHWQISNPFQPAPTDGLGSKGIDGKKMGLCAPCQAAPVQLTEPVKLSAANHLKPDIVIPGQVRKNAKAVVCMRIVTDGQANQITGFFLRAPEGLIVSTAHDLAVFQNLTVVLASGREISGQVIDLDRRVDLALIRVASELTGGIILDHRRGFATVNGWVYAIGCSSYSRGELISGLDNEAPDGDRHPFLEQVKMTVIPGSSGSPVFDAKGRLIAVVKGRDRVKKRVGYIIPIETVIAFVKPRVDHVR